MARSLETVLKAEGLAAEEVAKRKVEGLTIREQKSADGSVRRELLIGLREPKDKVRVFVADISIHLLPTPSSSSSLPFRSRPTRGRACRRSSRPWNTCRRSGASWSSRRRKTRPMSSTATRSGLFPTARRVEPSKIATFEVAMKAEGLAVLGVENDARGPPSNC